MKRRVLLDRLLRVDHAGEVAANVIYQGQLRVLGKDKDILHMKEQEKEHLRLMKEMMAKERVRPTLLMPVWKSAAYLLGIGGALLGKEAAMAVTVAVEEQIGAHYNDQLREVTEKLPEEKELQETLAKLRDEELDHIHIAKENNAEEAPQYQLLTSIVRLGVQASIKIAERL